MRYSVWIMLFLILFLFSEPVYSKEYRILINLPSRTLELFDGNKLVKTYPVGVGRKQFPTPTGNFKIISKIKHPTWENPYKRTGEVVVKPGKMNPLGTRWMGFYRKGKSEYGMHGTNNPSSVGKVVSHGCIRMRIKDAEELFSQVKLNTPVKVSYYCNKVKIVNGKISIKRYPNIYGKKVNKKIDLVEQLRYHSLPYA